MTVRGHAYERRGLLAIDPKAFLEVFFLDDTGDRENVEWGDTVIVDVRGPLETNKHYWCDSYEEIIERVQAACATAARAVVLRFDSPGGEAQGCFEATDQIRKLCADSGKQLHAFVTGDCCSAAYALACAAQSITISSTALVGSIGVLSCRDDVTAMNAARGLRVALITSGARKADGHPDNPITDAELAQTQSIIDSMASVFFDVVAGARPVTTEAVAAMQAKVFHGAAAIQAGLADAIGSLDTVIGRIAGVAQGDTTMASAYEKARAALQEAAEGDDANAAAAKAALAAMDAAGGGGGGGDGDGDGGDGDGDGDKDKPAPSTEGDPPAGDPPPKKDEDDPSAASQTTAREMMRLTLKHEKDLRELRRQIKERDERDERAALLASAKGLLSDDALSLLARVPLDVVRETISDALKDENRSKPTELNAKPTRGKDRDSKQGPQLPEADKLRLDQRMGLAAHHHAGVQDSDFRLTLGVASAPATTPTKAN